MEPQTTTVEVEYSFVYDPTYWDLMSPLVIKGEAIKPGSLVRVVRPVGDPNRRFVYIEDKAGNLQSVYTSSLTKIIG